ncbi:WD40-repeat-containing domain protein [Cladochytrium replicatum]|nr:WD40-repeat-containing domain protein [Cladochytrium replicatum]
MQPAATPSKPKTASTESLDSGSIIRSLAFHRHRSLLAVAHESNLVFLYNVSAKDGAYPERVLSHEYQRNITCMEFHPAAGCSLAVGTSTGVLLWRTHPRPTPTPWVTHLPTSPVSALSWSPSGTPLLCVGVHESATLYVFDADGLGMMPLRRYGGDGTREVQFSPNGRYLVQSCMTAQIRIWETDKWTCRELQMVAPVHSVNWMPDSKIFLHAIEGQSKIFGIGVSSSGISSVLQQRKSKDSNAPTFETREIIPEPVVDAEYDMPSGARISVGGEIERMTLDPMGRYLLVSFMSRGGNDDEAEDGSALLAVYSVATIPLPLFTLTGFVRGPEMRNEDGDDFKGKKKAREGDNEANGEGRRTEDARAIEVVFWGGVGGAGGAALVEALGCVGWENGEVGFLPFLRT